jgi:hypothetical protein
VKMKKTKVESSKEDEGLELTFILRAHH